MILRSILSCRGGRRPGVAPLRELVSQGSLCPSTQLRGHRWSTSDAWTARDPDQHAGPKIRKTPVVADDPLRILFCGSDAFSCASLAALYAEHSQNPRLVASIDVMARPGKRTGRGYKVIRHPPIRSLATDLGLPIHELDTFTRWNMPGHINLIVAVSFGLFVPPRLLDAAKFGGLNLHPSLLPQYRGPAPLHHTLLNKDKFTGVSLQTLDKQRLDHGIVLNQTPLERLLPVPPDCDVEQLQAIVTPEAAHMLVQGLRDRLHEPPLQDRGWATLGDRRPTTLGPPSRRDSTNNMPAPPKDSRPASPSPPRYPSFIPILMRPSLPYEIFHAPKITARDRQLILDPDCGYIHPAVVKRLPERYSRDHGPWANRLWKYQRRVEDFETRQRVVGPLWFRAKNKTGQLQRVIVDRAEVRRSRLVGGRPLEAAAVRAHQFNVYGDDPNGRPFAYPVACLTTEGNEGDEDENGVVHLVERNTHPLYDWRDSPAHSPVVVLDLHRLKVEGDSARPARQVLARLDAQLLFESPGRDATFSKDAAPNPLRRLHDHLRPLDAERWARREMRSRLQPEWGVIGPDDADRDPAAPRSSIEVGYLKQLERDMLDLGVSLELGEETGYKAWQSAMTKGEHPQDGPNETRPSVV